MHLRAGTSALCCCMIQFSPAPGPRESETYPWPPLTGCNAPVLPPSSPGNPWRRALSSHAVGSSICPNVASVSASLDRFSKSVLLVAVEVPSSPMAVWFLLTMLALARELIPLAVADQVFQVPGLYLQMLDIIVAELESSSSIGENLKGTTDLEVKVFDYPVTLVPDARSQVVAFVRGVFYQSAEDVSSDTARQEFDILFYDAMGTFTGTSLAVGGLWSSGYPKQFRILGGTGPLSDAEGFVVFWKLREAEHGVVCYLEIRQTNVGLSLFWIRGHLSQILQNDVDTAVVKEEDW